MGGVHALEERLEELEAQTPEGQEKMRETWGVTPEAIQSAQAFEQMFGGEAR